MTSNSGTVNRVCEKVETFAHVGGRGKIQVAIGRPHTLDFSPKALLSQHPNCISNRWPLLTHDVKGCLRKNAQDWPFQEQLSSPSASHWAPGRPQESTTQSRGNAVPRGRSVQWRRLSGLLLDPELSMFSAVCDDQGRTLSQRMRTGVSGVLCW